MSLLALARGDNNNRQAIPCDGGRCLTPVWLTSPVLTEGGALVDPARVITHPAYPAVAGQGIYEYPFNPDVTRNFIYAPATKVDVAVARTISSSVSIRRPQTPEDVLITEIWLGGDNQLSTLTEMARVFHDFWVTPCPVGQLVGWEPLDITTERYNVSIVRVDIGPVGGEYEYNEVRAILDSRAGSYLNKQLTLVMKLEKATRLPKGVITIEGV